MKKTVIAAGLLLATFTSVNSFAASIEAPDMSLAQANALANAAIAACQADGYQVSVTVVDRAGIVRAAQRMDNAGPHTVIASRMKAYTAVSTKSPTSKNMENAQKYPAAAHLADVPGFLLLAGGVPVTSQGKVIGAIGIGGAPGGNLDEACAQKAIDKSQELLK